MAWRRCVYDRSQLVLAINSGLVGRLLVRQSAGHRGGRTRVDSRRRPTSLGEVDTYSRPLGSRRGLGGWGGRGCTAADLAVTAWNVDLIAAITE